jgi:hypothetical protein
MTLILSGRNFAFSLVTLFFSLSCSNCKDWRVFSNLFSS